MKHAKILANGLNQARQFTTPPDIIDRLKIAILTEALERIANLGGHQGELAKAAIETVSEPNK